VRAAGRCTGSPWNQSLKTRLRGFLKKLSVRWLSYLPLLETAPWSGEPFNSANPRSNMLTHAFGELGLATYLVLEERREVYLLRIEWA